jgi:hypothetical protein
VVERKNCYHAKLVSNPACDMFVLHEPIVDLNLFVSDGNMSPLLTILFPQFHPPVTFMILLLNTSPIHIKTYNVAYHATSCPFTTLLSKVKLSMDCFLGHVDFSALGWEIHMEKTLIPMRPLQPRKLTTSITH